MTNNRLISRAASAVVTGVILSAVVGLSGGQYAFAQTSSLPPGTTTGPPVPIVATGTPPFGGTLLQEVRTSVFADNGTNVISGTVTSAVFRNASNFLDFYYQFAFDSETNIVVDTISLSSFTNVGNLEVGQTGEDVDGPGGLPADSLGGTVQNNFTPSSSTGSFSSANRPNVNGDGINATLLTGVTGNETTFTFLVRTEATTFSLAGSASVQGGGISAFTATQGAVAPLSGALAPEPGALSLLAMGIVAPLARMARRKHRRS